MMDEECFLEMPQTEVEKTQNASIIRLNGRTRDLHVFHSTVQHNRCLPRRSEFKSRFISSRDWRVAVEYQFGEDCRQ